MDIKERNLTRILEELVRTEERLAHAKAALTEELGYVRKRASEIERWDSVYTGQDHEYATVVSVEFRVPPDSGEAVVSVDFMEDDDLTKTFTKRWFYEDFVDVKVPVSEAAF